MNRWHRMINESPEAVHNVHNVQKEDERKTFEHYEQIEHGTERFKNAYSRISSLPRPSEFNKERWVQIQSDASAFTHLWASQAEALGWNPESTFALRGGLIPLIEGGDLLAVCEKTAVIRSPDGKQFNTCRFVALPGEAAPSWRVWASWCEP